MSMRIIRANDYDDLSVKAAAVIASQVNLKPDCVLGLATGSSPLGTYANLSKWNKEGSVDFSKVKSVNLDEYIGLSHDNDQSYYYFMNTNLFSKINIDPANTNVPNGLAPDMAAECKAYDQKIRDFGGIDLQLLGIGLTGHIGFNEPCAFFPKGTHEVDLNQKTIESNARFFASIDDVPKKAVTMGIQSIMSAKSVLLIANGKGKAEIMERALFGDICPEVPASVLQLHPNLIVICDEEAISVIAEKHPEAIG